LYQLQEYTLVIEGLAHCLRHEKTAKESQHLLAFSLLHTRQNKLAAAAFCKSIRLGNDTDWQPLIELLIEQPKLKLSGAAVAIAQGSGGSDALQ
jgi:cytochrome c-type biogenesis protein CcmH/NrfG